MPGRVYVGHWVATLDFSRKQRDMAWFYRGPFDEQRRQFLTDQRINFVVYGPFERRDAAWPGPTDAIPGLDLVYDANGVAIYEVVRS
jgi:hypothetical protein